MDTSRVNFEVSFDVSIDIDGEVAKTVLEHLKANHPKTPEEMLGYDAAKLANEQLCLRAYERTGKYKGLAEAVRISLHKHLRALVPEATRIVGVTDVSAIRPRIVIREK